MKKLEYDAFLKKIKKTYTETCDQAKRDMDRQVEALAVLFPEYSASPEVLAAGNRRASAERAPRLNVEEALNRFISDPKLPQDASFTAADVVGWVLDSTGLVMNRSSVVKALDRFSHTEGGTAPIIQIEVGKGRKPSVYERNLAYPRVDPKLTAVSTQYAEAQ